MLPVSEIQDMLALCRKYYARLQELLRQVPEGGLGERVGGGGLTVTETIQHVCEAERWYMNLIDGSSREAPASPATHAGLLAALAAAEAEMLAFLASLDASTLEATVSVAAWWGEDGPQSARLILMHSLAHKYYHCGQLQAVLHVMAQQKPSD